MKSEHRPILACLLVTLLFQCTRELPIDEHPHHEVKHTQMHRESNVSSLSSREDDNRTNSSRWDHARMREFDSTTTLGYDEWWFLTTPHRPFVSYRDFPGKSGVATWKEIGTGAASDQRTSRKVAGPTAEEVSSGASGCVPHCQPLQKLIYLLLATIAVQRSFWTILVT